MIVIFLWGVDLILLIILIDFVVDLCLLIGLSDLSMKFVIVLMVGWLNNIVGDVWKLLFNNVWSCMLNLIVMSELSFILIKGWLIFGVLGVDKIICSLVWIVLMINLWCFLMESFCSWLINFELVVFVLLCEEVNFLSINDVFVLSCILF